MKNHNLPAKSASIQRIAAALFLSLASLLAHADSNYQVEIVVFSRDAGDGEDSLRTSGALRYPSKTITLSAADGGMAAFQLLPPNNLLLNREASAIEQRKNMHVLLHQAWLWPGEDAAHASAVLIGAGRQFGSHRELEGYIALSAEHFLKIDTQLWLSRFSTNASGDGLTLPATPSTGGFISAGDAVANSNGNGGDSYSVSQLYLLREQRRMRSGELHYFDHSRLGLLVQVTPITATP